MSGPLVHIDSYRQLCKLIKKQYDIELNFVSKMLIMVPDVAYRLSGNHPGINVQIGKGTISAWLSSKMNEMRKEIKGDIKKYNKFKLEQDMIYISHYITDCFTFTHACPAAHKLETRLEPLSEFVFNKRKLGVSTRYYTFEEFDHFLFYWAHFQYERYQPNSKKWWFPLSGGFRQMVRETVKYGAEYSCAFLDLCIRGDK